MVVLLCLAALSLPVWAQNRQWEIAPEKDARVRAGKLSVVGGQTNEAGVRFVINHIDILQPMEIVLATEDAAKPLTLQVYKDAPEHALLKKATDAGGTVVAKFRTDESVHLMVSGPAGAKYQLMTWQGPRVEVPTPTPFVPIDARGTPLVEGVELTPPATAAKPVPQTGAATTTLEVPTSVIILLALILVAVVALAVVVFLRGRGGKTAAVVLLVLGLSAHQPVRGQSVEDQLAPKKVDTGDVWKAVNERLNQLREQLDTLEKMGIKVEPEAIKVRHPDDKEEEKKEGAPSLLGGMGRTAGHLVSDTKLILAFLEEFGLIDPREAAVQPNYNPPGQPLIPSRCAGTGQCGACFADANAKLEKSRKLLEDMYVIYKQTELKTGRIHELANAAAGLSPYAQLAWTAIKNNPNEPMNVAQRRFYDTYDTNLEKLLTMSNEGLIGVGACERDNFKDYDWYPRYGMIYYNFLKERYTRK
jgi:hypothetical protein